MTAADQMRSLVHYLAAAHIQRLAAVAEMHSAAARDLAARRRGLQKAARDVASFLKEARDTHETTAKEQRERLAEHMNAVRAKTAVFLEEAASHRRATAEEQRERLAAQRAELASGVAEVRSSLQDDLGEARGLWSALGALKQGAEEKTDPPASPPRSKRKKKAR